MHIFIIYSQKDRTANNLFAKDSNFANILKNKAPNQSNRGFFYNFTLISLLLLKEWFMTTFLRSIGVSISNSSSAVQSNITQSILIVSMLGSLIPFSYLL